MKKRGVFAAANITEKNFSRLENAMRMASVRKIVCIITHPVNDGGKPVRLPDDLHIANPGINKEQFKQNAKHNEDKGKALQAPWGECAARADV